MPRHRAAPGFRCRREAFTAVNPPEIDIVNLLIRQGRIIDPSRGLDRVGDVLISGGKIAAVFESVSEPPSPIEVFPAEGLIVCPGFVDLHCHLRQPGFEEKETIATGTLAAARGGFTTICCMPNTEPALDTPEIVNHVRRSAQTDAVVRVLPIAAVTVGRRGEALTDLAALAEAGAVAFSDDGNPVWDGEIMRRALLVSKALGRPIVDHCEDPTLSRGGVMNEGAVSKELGLKGIPAEAEERMVERDIALARATGGRLHIAHVSTAGSVERIRRAKAEGIGITAEVTPHHLTLTEEAVRSHGAMAKVNPPLRTEKDLEAMTSALRDGTIDAIATDHAPHTAEEKSRPFDRAPFGISGLETAFATALALVHRGTMDLGTLISRLTVGPARVIGKDPVLGTLRVGTPADIAIFDPNAEWSVTPEDFASKGKNTPYAGRRLRGRIVATIAEGRLVYALGRG